MPTRAIVAPPGREWDARPGRRITPLIRLPNVHPAAMPTHELAE
ncbi:MAG: hypothetical protein ACRECP_02565 [Methylocella sp.]